MYGEPGWFQHQHNRISFILFNTAFKTSLKKYYTKNFSFIESTQSIFSK